MAEQEEIEREKNEEFELKRKLEEEKIKEVNYYYKKYN